MPTMQGICITEQQAIYILYDSANNESFTES